jgi:transcriptional regulator with XRE-family HTH domain
VRREGRTLREARIGKRVALREVARRIGVAPSTLSYVENGRDRPSDRVVDGYALALGVDRDELYRAIGRVPRDVLTALTSTPGAFARVRAGLDSESEDESASFTESDRDIEAIESLLECDGVRPEERETFEAWVDLLASGKIEQLTSRQRARVQRVRVRVGDADEAPANLWSQLSPEEQNRQREDARRVVLPWERDKRYETPDKLPER